MKCYSAKQKLEKAYFDMLENTHYSKITVSDIISIADVSRTTFYRYYVDIFDMHKKIADSLAFSVIEKSADMVIKSQNGEDYFEGVLKILNTQEKYILLISGKNGSRYFFESMVRNAQEYISLLSTHYTEEEIFRLRFMTVAMVGVYVRDILQGRKHNPNYIEICKKMLKFDESFGGYHVHKC